MLTGTPQLHFSTTSYSFNLIQLNETAYVRDLSITLWITYGNSTARFLSCVSQMLSTVSLFELLTRHPDAFTVAMCISLSDIRDLGGEYAIARVRVTL